MQLLHQLTRGSVFLHFLFYLQKEDGESGRVKSDWTLGVLQCSILASPPVADLCEVPMDELVELSERDRIVKLVFMFLKRQTEISTCRFLRRSFPSNVAPKQT